MSRLAFQLLPVLALGCLAGLSAIAQTHTPAECPTIEVNGPFWIVEDGHPFKFAATVKRKHLGKVKYKWTVSKGQIIDGQGTAEITVIDTEREGSLTGTVEVVGLPKGFRRQPAKQLPREKAYTTF